MKYRTVTVAVGWWEDSPRFTMTQEEIVNKVLHDFGPTMLTVGIADDQTHEYEVEE